MTVTVVNGNPIQPAVIKVNVPGVPGSPGKNVELTKSATHIQWRVVGDTTWINLVALSEITGTGGGGTQDLSAYAKTADVQNLLNAKVNTTTTVTAGTGLTGGGDLSTNRTLAVTFGTAAGTVTQGNDSRLTNTRIPTDNTVTTVKIVDGAVTSAKIADGTIVNADISSTAAIATSKISGLSTVATTGSYNDLTDKPAASSGGTITDATTTAKGVVQLAGDLAGTASSPTVPALANKVNTNDSRLTDTRTPTDGTVTTPKLADNSVTSSKIVDGTIVNSDISNTAAIATSKISGLSTVATTGSYNDLLNKPAAGSGGVSVSDDPDNPDALLLETGVTATDNIVSGFVSSSGSQTNNAVKSVVTSQLPSNIVTGDGINKIVKMTQSAYDALATKDSSTLYVVSG